MTTIIIALGLIVFIVFIAVAWCLNERTNAETRKDIVSIEETTVLTQRPVRIPVKY